MMMMTGSDGDYRSGLAASAAFTFSDYDDGGGSGGGNGGSDNKQLGNHETN